MANPHARYNALPAEDHELALPEPVTAAAMRKFLAGAEARTFDVFVFNDLPAEEMPSRCAAPVT